MKSRTFLSLLAVTCTLCSCSDIMEEPVVSSVEMKISQELDYKVTPDEAMEIANGFFKQKLSRSAVLNTDYATITPKSRAESADTLAYIVTPSDGEGFVLVSTDKRMPPVLAFSETGTFENSDNPVYSYIIDGLDKYKPYEMDMTSNGYYFKSEYNLFDRMVELCPEDYWQWDQKVLPYTKYVDKEHPGCPVGCVGLATTMAMLYSRDTVTVRGEFFNLYAIRNGLPHPDRRVLNPLAFDIEPEHFISIPLYDQAQAMDRIAKLLYLVGKDLNLRYEVGKTSGSSGRVAPYLRRLGYKLVHNNLQSFNVVDIVNNILNENIIYFSASLLNQTQIGGHAWNIDGCCFDYIDGPTSEILETTIKNIFIRCNWGEGNAYNGYYNGDVFWYNWHKYGEAEYLAVEKTRELKKLKK